ncbi:MAG: SCO family protein [Deltaproteobacteria bacterium]|nr:SCO family protein [Deltaproteobacteria bacterium]
MNLNRLLTSVAACLLLLAPISASSLESRSIYRSKSLWETHAGEKTTLVRLRGAPVVATMVYTSCQMSCPLMMNDLKAIEKALPAAVRSQVRFAVFALDSANDVPAKLRDFAEKHGVDLTRWTFFHGSPASVREVAALLGVRFKELEGGGFDHSNVITILDSEGVIVHQKLGLRQNPDDTLKTLERLAARR